MAFNANYNKASKKNAVNKKNEGRSAVFGVYLAEIVSTKDISRTGRVRVFIPAISKDKNSTAGYFDAVWTSPFAGGTDPRVIGTEIENPQQSMSSYGFWGVVPDNGNLVLIAFGDGNTKYPMVMSCLFPDKYNSMIPANAGNKTYQSPGLNLPTVEKNKRTADINHNDTFRPIQHTLAEAIVKQGLAMDPIRGAGSSSARRESPSEVFGLLTPGPRDPLDFNYRLGGHSITLDDNLGSRQIRIRSSQGSQLLLDDTSGMVYLINRDGNVWMEFASSGEVFMYAENDINMRTKRSFNLRADNDVNIEAGQNVNIKAAMDHDGAAYVGEGAGAGGTVNIESKADMNLFAESNFFQTSNTGETHLNSAGSFYNTTGVSIEQLAEADIINSAGGKASTKAGGEIILQASGNIVEKGSKVLMNSGGSSAATATAATTAETILTDTHLDQPAADPGYDRDADSPVLSNGQREGEKAQVVTIVTTLVTAEPFEGHGLPSPANDDQENMAPDDSIASSMPNNSNGVGAGNQPASINSPSGFKRGIIGPDGKPTYTSPAQVQNNFTLAKNKQADAAMMGKLTSALSSSIPAVRKPTTTPRGARMIGINGRLNSASAKAKQMAYNTKGLPTDLTNSAVQSMQGAIMTAARSGGNKETIKNSLLAQGISTINDGNSLIYANANGIKLVDFSRQLGPIGLQMNTSSNLLNTYRKISPFINSPVSDNQVLALVSLADHIGAENFLKSKVLNEVNHGDWGRVPNLMTSHSTLSVAGKKTFQPAHLARRQYEGMLFQTPDSVSIPQYTHQVSFNKQANDLNNLIS